MINCHLICKILRNVRYRHFKTNLRLFFFSIYKRFLVLLFPGYLKKNIGNENTGLNEGGFYFISKIYLNYKVHLVLLFLTKIINYNNGAVDQLEPIITQLKFFASFKTFSNHKLTKKN